MNAKRKGTRNERRSRALLEAAGYRVTRAAGSLGAWDLIGIRAADVVLVQVTTRSWPGRLERQALAEFAAPPQARKLIHRWRDRQRLPDVQELSPQREARAPAELRPGEQPVGGRRRRKDARLGPHAVVGDRLRLARRGARLTVVALAGKAGVGRMTVIRAERGDHLPRAAILRRIGEATGVSVDWLLTGSDRGAD